MERLNFRDSVAPPACPKCTVEISKSMLSDLRACAQRDFGQEYLEEQQRILEENFDTVVFMLRLLFGRCCECPDFPRERPLFEQILFVNRHFNDRVVIMEQDEKYREQVPAVTKAAPLIVSFLCQEARSHS